MQERDEILDNQVRDLILPLVVGQLTPSLLHEINNMMQSVRGASALGLEELDDAASVQTYLQLILHESERVTQAIERVRRVYHVEHQAAERLDVNHLLREALTLLQPVLERYKVQCQTEFAMGLPLVTAVYGHINLAVLYPLLTVSKQFARTGPCTLLLQTQLAAENVRLTMRWQSSVLPTFSAPLVSYASVGAACGLHVRQQALADGYELHFII